ncbi:hypothetical protein THASP1DRAFT_26311, partial [Thamnocephalis sphaerospora]
MATDAARRKQHPGHSDEGDVHPCQGPPTKRSRWEELAHVSAIAAARLIADASWPAVRGALHQVRLVLESLARRPADAVEISASTSCQAAAHALARTLCDGIVCMQPAAVEYALRLLCFVLETQGLDSAAREHQLRTHTLSAFFQHGGGPDVVRAIRSPVMPISHYALRFVNAARQSTRLAALLPQRNLYRALLAVIVNPSAQSLLASSLPSPSPPPQPDKPWLLAISMLAQLVRASRSNKEKDPFAEHFAPIVGAWRASTKTPLPQAAAATASEHTAKLLHLVLTILDASPGALAKLDQFCLVDALLVWWRQLLVCIRQADAALPDVQSRLRLLYRSSTLPLWALELYTQRPASSARVYLRFQEDISALLLQTFVALADHDSLAPLADRSATPDGTISACLETALRMFIAHIARFGVARAPMEHRKYALSALSRISSLFGLRLSGEMAAEAEGTNDKADHSGNHDVLDSFIGSAHRMLQCDSPEDTATAMDWDEARPMLLLASSRLWLVLQPTHKRSDGDHWSCELFCLGIRYNTFWITRSDASKMNLTRLLFLHISGTSADRRFGDALTRMVKRFGECLIWRPENASTLIVLAIVCARRLESSSVRPLAGSAGTHLSSTVCWQLLQAAMDGLAQRVADAHWLRALLQFSSAAAAVYEASNESEARIYAEEESRLCALHATHWQSPESTDASQSSARSIVPLLLWLLTAWSPVTSTEKRMDVDPAATVRGTALRALSCWATLPGARSYLATRLDELDTLRCNPSRILLAQNSSGASTQAESVSPARQ